MCQFLWFPFFFITYLVFPFLRLLYILMPVFYGILMYMDVFSLNLLQFIAMTLIWQFHEISNIFNIFREITTRIVFFWKFREINIILFSPFLLQYIPMPVLYGVLMYMGVSSLKGMQFIDRVGLIFMPPKYQPDYYYLRHVPIKKVHLFTFIQVC